MGTIVTTQGLISNAAAAASALPVGQWAIAFGTPDQIQASYPIPNTILYDGLLLFFRASAANLTPTPQFSPDGLQPATITAYGGQPPLVSAPSFIPGPGAEMAVRYNAQFSRWELLNPTGG